MNGENQELKIYHLATMGLGSLLVAVMIWVGAECSHIPAIETKLTAMETTMAQTTNWQSNKIGEHTSQLVDHEKRIQRIEDGALKRR